jgi:hypothetical protein
MAGGCRKKQKTDVTAEDKVKVTVALAGKMSALARKMSALASKMSAPDLILT